MRPETQKQQTAANSKQDYRAGASVIQHRRKTLHSRTKENRLVSQIQKALWRKWWPLFSRNKKLYVSKEVKENALASEGKSCRPETITTVNRYVSWPLSVKHAAKIRAKITFAQSKCRTFQSIIYPAEEKPFIGTSSILAWGKTRVGFPFIAPILSTFTLLRHFRHHLLRCTANKSAISKP